MRSKDALGLLGEGIAARYLASHGYAIIARRWKARWAEIDLVVRMGGEVVFVEVKTRRDEAFGRPEEAVTRQKREALRRAASMFLAEKNIRAPFRIDVICVTVSSGRTARVRHFLSAVGDDD